MRTALVLSGLPRDFERAAGNIQENIIERFSIRPRDIFVSVWSDRGYWYPGDANDARSFAESGRVSLKAIESIYSGAAVDLEDFEERKTEFADTLKSFQEVHLPSKDHSNYMVRGLNLISMLYKINRGLKPALADSEITHIVRTRPDLVLSKGLPKMPSQKIVVAKQANHLGLGIGDNLHFGPSWAHVPIMNAIENLKSLFERNSGILCPHQLLKVAFDSSRVPFVQRKIKFETLHTPGGMYKARAKDGNWESAQNVDYPRINSPFRGSP